MDSQPAGHRSSPSRGHAHSQSHSGAISNPGPPGARYSRPSTAHSGSNAGKGNIGVAARTLAARRESTPRSVPPASPIDGIALAAIGGGMQMGMGMGMGMPMGRGGPLLPSVAEMTTGVSPYNTPAYSMSMPMSMPMSGGYSSPGPLLPAIGMMGGRSDHKRPRSPDMNTRETSRRRQ